MKYNKKQVQYKTCTKEKLINEYVTVKERKLNNLQYFSNAILLFHEYL